MSELTARLPKVKVRGERREPTLDVVAHEEPLELQVHGSSLAVVMRTPGHDEELGAGFLLTEGVISSWTEVESIRHCTTVPTPEAEDNVLQIQLRAPVDLAKFKRHQFASSSCGVCGKATLENALRTSPAIRSELTVTPAVLVSLSDKLRANQPAFDSTGGLHAAGLFTVRGELLVVREDVGRHNAVDKVIGWALHSGTSMSGAVMMVSGRLSFELVQKCVAAKIPVLAGISAPTSLAVRMADALGVTLVGFLRDDGMNVYAHAERITVAT